MKSKSCPLSRDNILLLPNVNYHRLQKLSFPKLDELAKESLSFFEFKKYKNIRTRLKKAQMLYGRLVLKEILASEFNLLEDFTKISIENSEKEIDRGAPFIVSKEIKGDLSISHSQIFIAGIYSNSGMIGIDCQSIIKDISHAHILSDEECKFILNQNVEWQDYYLTLIWSLKEALVKSLKIGFRYGINSVTICPTQSLETVTIKVSDKIKAQCRETLEKDIHFMYDYSENKIFSICEIKNG
ncbi:4'-phosphopantetheinyl transferase family protein [Listeria aquatica]|uniref:4'-phosphopantetheinyl transferase family protein n=1 Tax=Listeria aquatica TaxID=1494960 RepID=UPI003F70FA52